MSNTVKVLIVDDEETIRKLLTTNIQKKGHQVVAVEDGFRACDVYGTFQPDVIVSDIKMPRMNGFQMFDQLRSKYGDVCPVIYITGHGEKSAAIESLRKGAFDYLEKPFDMDEFAHILDSAVQRKELVDKNKSLTAELAVANEKLKERLEARTELVRRIQHPEGKNGPSLESLGKSPAIAAAKSAIERLSESEVGSSMGVLITGPSGAGKEVAARLIHELSPRAKGPWVAVNCGALPEHLIESELFGHEKGAFTGAQGKKLGVFELADGGTLFLDEVGELPAAMQSKLLRVLQEQSFRRVGGTEEVKVDVRILAATNKDLAQAIREKSFREDLYFRLNAFTIELPSLRERIDDIAMLASGMLKEITKGMTKAPREFTLESIEVLKGYKWPGNIRELKSTVQRAAMLANGPVITPDVVKNALGVNNVVSLRVADSASASMPRPATGPAIAPPAENLGGMSYHSWKKHFMKSMERDYLQQQLQHFKGNVSAMARVLKISRPNLCRLLSKHGLAAEEFRKAAETVDLETKAA